LILYLSKKIVLNKKFGIIVLTKISHLNPRNNEIMSYDKGRILYPLPIYKSPLFMYGFELGIRNYFTKRIFCDLSFNFEKNINKNTSFESYNGKMYSQHYPYSFYFKSFNYLQSVNFKIGYNFNFKI
jgi:hypothetical protein